MPLWILKSPECIIRDILSEFISVMLTLVKVISKILA